MIRFSRDFCVFQSENLKKPKIPKRFLRKIFSAQYVFFLFSVEMHVEKLTFFLRNFPFIPMPSSFRYAKSSCSMIGKCNFVQNRDSNATSGCGKPLKLQWSYDYVVYAGHATNAILLYRIVRHSA